ncbi:hypothetical protein [Streptosporangium sp. NPDC087985]|uniref:hypothetical protein n=1 Tax=Streptosporangium sp. NPDC087985 TaxID=3366196 RepID=UPI0037F1A000
MAYVDHQTAVAGLSCFRMMYGAGVEAVSACFLMALVGIPIYIRTKAERGEYGPGTGLRRPGRSDNGEGRQG